MRRALGQPAPSTNLLRPARALFLSGPHPLPHFKDPWGLFSISPVISSHPSAIRKVTARFLNLPRTERRPSLQPGLPTVHEEWPMTAQGTSLSPRSPPPPRAIF